MYKIHNLPIERKAAIWGLWWFFIRFVKWKTSSILFEDDNIPFYMLIYFKVKAQTTKSNGIINTYVKDNVYVKDKDLNWIMVVWDGCIMIFIYYPIRGC